jgi:hypothetical protein
VAKITLKDGSILEGTTEELAELMKNVGGLGVEFTEDDELKVGDYVVPLESADDEYEITNTKMKLGKVVEGDVDCCCYIRIEVVAHEDDKEVGNSYQVESKYFRKATDEEVAQAKAEHERKQAEQKWAKIGRKPGEFKKGDIVRVVEYTGAHEIGEIVELAEYGANEYLGKDGVVLVGEPEWFELIAPVESRVDIDD